MNPKRRGKLPLAAEVALVLACKLCALFALWYFCFGPETRLATTPEVVAQALLSPSTSASSRHPYPAGESQ